MNQEKEDIISIRNLYKSFNNLPILSDVNLSVSKGHLVSIIGRSGCGKTTLLRCLNCLEILDSGTIRIAGVTITHTAINHKKRPTVRKRLKNPFAGYGEDALHDEEFQIKARAVRQRVGMLFQGFNLFPHLSVLENVTIAQIKVKKEPENVAIARAMELLDKVGMSAFAKRFPHQISGGQAQRVAIARALALSPQVMLYDEPTSALDPELAEEVLTVMKNLHKEGMPQVVVTHLMNFARTASDVIVFMDEGEIKEIGSPETIFNNPLKEDTRQFLNIFKE